MQKLFYSTLSFVFAALLIFILLITSFEAVCYWTPGYYKKEFRKYNVAGAIETWTGDRIPEASLDDVIRQTMSYLRGNRKNLIVETEINGTTAEFYNENEKSHMADVRDLFVFCITLRSLSVLTCLAIAGLLTVLLGARQAVFHLCRGYTRVCALILAVSAAVGLCAVINFDKAFTTFHEIFFSQGNWMFDPRESRMIDMLPEAFFSDTALYVFLLFLAAVLLLLLPAVLRTRCRLP